MKTDITPSTVPKSNYSTQYNEDSFCACHKKAGHKIVNCITFKKLSRQDKLNSLNGLNMCHNCLGKHNTSDCKSSVKCNHCQNRHATVLH